MKKFKFRLYMERELFSEGDTAEEARQNLIERLAGDEEEGTFMTDASDYIDTGREYCECGFPQSKPIPHDHSVSTQIDKVKI